MGIYVGNRKQTGSTEVSVGASACSVFIGMEQVYPENISYVYHNLHVEYSSGNKFNAGGTNRATIVADVDVYSDGVYVTTYFDYIMHPVQVAPSSFHPYLISGTTYGITAESRTNVTGSEISNLFDAKFPLNNYEVVGRVTLVQEANAAIHHNITTSVAYTGLHPDTGSQIYGNTYIDSSGGKYSIMGQRYYKDWYSYTSGYNDDGSIYTSGNTYTIAENYSNLGSWLHVYSADTSWFTADTNSGTSNRTQTITARFSGGTDTSYTDVNFTINQYRAPYDTYEYRINSWNIDQTEWAYNQSGTTYYATVTADCEYRTVHWDNGSTSYGSWIDYNTHISVPTPVYNNRPKLVCGQGHWGFYTYPSGTASQTAYLYYDNQYSTYGKMRVYPVTGNPNSMDLTNTLKFLWGDVSSEVTLTQKGDGTFNINPSRLSFGYAASSATIAVTTSLSNWSVNDTADWITTSISGDVVTVTVTANYQQSTRAATVNFIQGGSLKAQCVVTQAAPSGVTIPGITRLYELGDGWIVGYYITSKNTSPCSWNARTLVIARNDAGSNTTFSLTGHYDTHMCGTNTDVNWSRSSITYTAGTKLTGTALPGETQWDCYGISIGGGPEANTQSAYAGISII